MNIGALLLDLREPVRVIEVFLTKWKDQIVKFLVSRDISGDEALFQEILAELMDGAQRVLHLARYLTLQIVQTGELTTDQNGNVLLNGNILPLMKEFEVCLYDSVLAKMTWTRTFVTVGLPGQAPTLAGLAPDMEINGIQARTRW